MVRNKLKALASLKEERFSPLAFQTNEFLARRKGRILTFAGRVTRNPDRLGQAGERKLEKADVALPGLRGGVLVGSRTHQDRQPCDARRFWVKAMLAQGKYELANRHTEGRLDSLLKQLSKVVSV